MLHPFSQQSFRLMYLSLSLSTLFAFSPFYQSTSLSRTPFLIPSLYLMDGQDHLKPTASAGHEVHGVHRCHICGWPFPNAHPSGRYRRSHKKVCGKLEGYKIGQSNLDTSDEEHASDEDEPHTPSPKIEKKILKEAGSSGVRERSKKSEDDVFSDAVTEFSASGTSPSLEESVNIIKGDGDDQKIEQNNVEGNNNVNLLQKVDDSAETTDKLNDPVRSDQLYTDADAVSVELDNHIQSKDTKHESQKRVDIQAEGDKLVSVSLKSEEEKASDPALMAAERKDEPNDKDDGNIHILDVTNSTVVEDKPELEDAKVPPAGKSDAFAPSETTGDEVDPSKEKRSDAAVAFPVVRDSSALEDGSATRVLEGYTNHHNEKVNCELTDDGSESDKGVAIEEHVILDSSKPSVISANLLPPAELDVDPRQLESLSESHSGLLDFKDAGFMRSRQGIEACVTGLGTVPNLDVPDVGVKPIGVVDTVDESNSNSDVPFSGKNQEQPISKEFTSPRSESLILVEYYDSKDSFTKDVPETETSNVQVDNGRKHDDSAVILPENSDSSPLKLQETWSVDEKCLPEADSQKSPAAEDFSKPSSVGIVEAPDTISISPLAVEPISSPLHSHAAQVHSSDDNKKISYGENANEFNSKSVKDEGDGNGKVINEKDGDAAMFISGGSSVTDSLEGKWGSISAVETNSLSSPKSETNVQKKSTNIKSHQSKSDDFEPPSFMTLVQSGNEVGTIAAPTDSEIEPVQTNQQQKSESVQLGWFPSLTNVVNDSQGRKKNEEIIAKVTNWNSGKEHHSQLKSLLNEAKSPNMKQRKDETSQKANGVAETARSPNPEPEDPKPETSHKEDWNSPARYPTMIKKEKKKSKPYWVPFVCCSSVNRDL